MTKREVPGSNPGGQRAVQTARDRLKVLSRCRWVGCRRRYPLCMTTREKAHRLLDELPDSQVEPVIEFIAARREGADGQKRARRPRLGLGRSTDGRSAAQTATEPIARPPA